MGKIILILVKLYQWGVSPLLGRNCRFYPSCSQYAAEVLQALPVSRAIGLIVKRIFSCHPFHPGGLDQVPHR